MAPSARSRGLPWVWGESPEERWLTDLVRRAPKDVKVAVRTVSTHATREALYLWLCQLRRAPYSYDWLDNFGRRSPRSPDPDFVTNMSVGQSVMTIFTVVDFRPNSSLSLRMKSGWPTRLFGQINLVYEIDEVRGRRLLRAVMFMPRTAGPFSGLRRYLLAWGDVVMMRKQLFTLRALAEGSSAVPCGS